MLEPLAIGNWTLKADVSAERSTRRTSGRTGVKVARGRSPSRVSAPSAITVRMYQRPRGGKSLSKTLISIPWPRSCALGESRGVDSYQTVVLYNCLSRTHEKADPARGRPGAGRRGLLRLHAP